MEKLGIESYENDLWVCAQCGYCKAVCEVQKYEGWESVSPRGRIYFLKALRNGTIKPGSEEFKKFSDNVFKCTLCARCRFVCPTDINTRGLQMALREALVHTGHYPQNLNMAKEALEAEHNPLNFPNESRAEFIEFMDDPPDDLYQKEKAEVVYFVGCIASFSPAVSSIPEAMINILNHAGIDFAVMGENEWCCGFPLIAAGMHRDAQYLKDHNLERIRQLGAKTIITGCPSCYNTWTEEYETDAEVLHASQFLKRLIDQGKLKVSKSASSASYHDPCDLSRNSGVYDEPRAVIDSCVQLRELPEFRERGFCCGGGGDLEAVDADLANKIAGGLADIVAGNQVEELITGCQQCKRMMVNAFKDKGHDIKVRDIIEMVHDSLQE